MDTVNRAQIVARWKGGGATEIVALAATLVKQAGGSVADGFLGISTYYSPEETYFELRNLGLQDSDYSILMALPDWTKG